MAETKYMPASSTEPVDEILPAGPWFALGLQHVLVTYAGAVVVPLIIGSAAGLSTEQITFLINADLLVTGIITLIQSAGIKWFGVRLPIIMSVSFTPVGPMIAMASNPEIGLLGIYGATLAAGLFGLVISPVMGKLLRFFPPVVLGTELIMVGLSIMMVPADWAAGGMGDPNYGSLSYIGISAIVGGLVLILNKFCRGFISHIAVLLAICIGLLIAMATQDVNFSAVGQASWFGIVTPLHFGMPEFHFWPVLAMCIIMFATFIESTGMFYAVGEITGKKLTRNDMVKGFRADSLGYITGAIFNTFPYTSFAENVGLVQMTGVRSRWVTAASGVIFIILGLIPKLAAVVASVPVYVLGGATLIMFGLIATTGMKMLHSVDYKNPFNEYIVATSIGVGMLPVVAPKFFSQFPAEMAPFLNSGILLSAISAVLLNIFFNGIPKDPELFNESKQEPKPIPVSACTD